MQKQSVFIAEKVSLLIATTISLFLKSLNRKTLSSKSLTGTSETLCEPFIQDFWKLLSFSQLKQLKIYYRTESGKMGIVIFNGREYFIEITPIETPVIKPISIHIKEKIKLLERKSWQTHELN